MHAVHSWGSPIKESTMTRAEKLRALADALTAHECVVKWNCRLDTTVQIGVGSLSAYVNQSGLVGLLAAEVARCEAALKEDDNA